MSVTHLMLTNRGLDEASQSLGLESSGPALLPFSCDPGQKVLTFLQL